MKRAPLIAIEGIDGTGKGTQARLLLEALHARRHRAELFSFPSYEKTLAGRLVAGYLNGELGDPKTIDSRLAALLYALDRYEIKGAIEQTLARGAFAVCDRFVGSNLAHQVARAPQALRPAVRELIEKLEFGLLALPRPDLVIYFDMPERLAQERVKTKGARAYTRKQLDAHEADRRHLREALHEYRRQATSGKDWVTVPTVGPTGQPRSREEIHADVIRALEKHRLLKRRARERAPTTRSSATSGRTRRTQPRRG